MPELVKDIYAGSCNPARRAKQPRPEVSTAKPPQQRSIVPILPRQDEATVASFSTAPHPAPPARRGRKPGPLSRSARETQRKLNHSIIEKARRTKINDALATLRRLVPADFGCYPKDVPSDAADATAVGDDAPAKKPKPGRKEEKEKEFKLEILVRTVAFMQELLARVNELESGTRPCPRCAERDESSKRKRSADDEGAEARYGATSKRLRGDSDEYPGTAVDQHSSSGLRATSYDGTPTVRPYTGSPLPSISSWLPRPDIEPLPSPPPRQAHPTVVHLPSPPSSAHFEPVMSLQTPPTLSLGPKAMSSPAHTPEDESAASLLLQISASSPLMLPSKTRSTASSDSSRTSRGLGIYVNPRPSTVVQAQTPSSLLGLMNPS